MFQGKVHFQYVPILALSPSEITAIAELPEKSKDGLLPVIPLKGWGVSNELKNSIAKIKDSIGDRHWIADIDSKFLSGNKNFKLTGEYPRKVFYEIEALLSPDNGYENWYQYVKSLENAIPVIQIDEVVQIESQVLKFISLGRGIVFRLKMSELSAYQFEGVLKSLERVELENFLVIFDFGDITRSNLERSSVYADVVKRFQAVAGDGIFSLSATSFPHSFMGVEKGEASIYERQLFKSVSDQCPDLNWVYSDWASARAEKQSGGSRTPPPRIDYALKNEWFFVKRDFDDPKNIGKNESVKIYKSIAKEVMASDFWIDGLHLWGTQMIERTKNGDEYGITSPRAATAVRLNLHLYQQLNYDVVDGLLDTDEDWED